MLVVLSKALSLCSYDSILEIAEKAVDKGEKVAILHIQDACVAATLSSHCRRLKEKGIGAYVLEADCVARGLLNKVEEGVKIMNYKEWVNLVMNQYDKIVSWT